MTREQIGEVNIDWQQAALGIGKNRRKTVGFGKYDKRERSWQEELYIRELSIIDGGIGCALWDAAIILSRWIRGNASLFTNKTVLELGSGVGLPGIMCGRICGASKVYLTDYLEPIMANLRYNVDINFSTAAVLEDTDSDDSEELRLQKAREIEARKSNMHTVLLDWYDIEVPEKRIDLGKVDVIIGSELTYTLDKRTIECLAKVIDFYLDRNNPDARFYEILSDDRDGVDQFIEVISKYGFDVDVTPFDAEYLAPTKTKQRPETYKLYTFYRSHKSSDIGSDDDSSSHSSHSSSPSDYGSCTFANHLE